MTRAQMVFRTLDGPFDIGGTVPVAPIYFVEERERFLETPDHADQFPLLLPVRSHLRPNPSAIKWIAEIRAGSCPMDSRAWRGSRGC